MAKMNVELMDGSTALGSYGHSFNSIEDAKVYLSEQGGGTIAIVPNEWEDYETQGWQDFDHEIDSEVLIVVEREDADEAQQTLNDVMSAAEAASEYELSESAVRQAINRGTLVGRKSGGTWLVLRKHVERLWGYNPN